ncbi:hypothetical protein [Actinomadura nitritigenes]|uniref:hypothetical protein n=1 Tax=Actinomadura nitritigenes TaxID=134602 RepID=UPI003D907160
MIKTEVELRAFLGPALHSLAEEQRLTVLEVATSDVRRFEVVRDRVGVLRGRRLADLPPDTTAVNDTDSALLIRTAVGRTQIDEVVRNLYPDVTEFVAPDADLIEVLRGVVADDRLTRSYELVVVRRTPDGGVQLQGLPLFAAGAGQGETVHVTLRCLTDRLVLAVCATGEDGPRLLSLDATKLAPDTYQVIVELRRPGLVRFTGLPEEPRPTGDRWSDLVAGLPRRFPSARPHLICAVEVSGSEEQVAMRLHLLDGAIGAADDAIPGLQVSVIPYGSHEFRRGVRDAPVRPLAQEVEPAQARSLIRAQAALETGYVLAAQIECMLETLLMLVGEESAADSALLTVGDRPAFPPRANETEILPCPYRRDWEAALASYGGRALVAVCDRPTDAAEQVWHRLGRDLLVDLDGADIREVVAALALAPDRRPMPFPLIEMV